MGQNSILRRTTDKIKNKVLDAAAKVVLAYHTLKK